MKFVDDAKDAWKWFSMKAMAVAATFPIVWDQLPDEYKLLIPSGYMKYIVAAILIGGMVGRLVDQKKPKV